MFNLDDMQTLVDKINKQGDGDNCGDTFRAIRGELFPNSQFKQKTIKMWNGMEEDFSEEEYDIDLIIEIISDNLANVGMCGIVLFVGQSDHIFFLMRIDGQVYRVESYMFEYQARIVEFSDWEVSIRGLLIDRDESECLWNKTFGVSEQYQWGSDAIDIKTYRRLT